MFYFIAWIDQSAQLKRVSFDKKQRGLFSLIFIESLVFIN